MNIDELLQILVCPKCHADLIYMLEGGFLCEKCALVYPVRDEIPIMLINEAIPLAEWEKKCAS